MSVDERELTDHLAKLEELIEKIESFPDPAVRSSLAELVQGLLLLYGEGFAHVLALVRKHGGSEASAILEAFTHDDLVSHLLLLHDLHPVDLETRVLQALDEVRPYLQSHGGNVELLDLEGGVAHLRLQGSCDGCPASSMTLKTAIEDAVQRAAPDLEAIVAEGVSEAPPQPVAFIAASELLKSKRPPSDHAVEWTTMAIPNLAAGGAQAATVSGVPVLFLKIEENLYAYRNACPACAQPLEEGVLRGTELTCPGCGRLYDIRRAGRSLDVPDQHLVPMPLLVENDAMKIAVKPA